MLLRYRAWTAAAGVFALALVLGAPGIGADAQRTISLYNIHTKETLTATYKRNGKYVPEELVKVSWILRDWRRDEATTMDPELIDLLWEVHSELGSQEPIHIISGYRSRGTNDMLRKTVGGQASESRHILGKAADVHFPDVPVKALRYSALIREKGGVGYYPTSALPFVHMDIDRVRAWPRLTRPELALLFPSGQTKHVPADGEPITKADVREAQAKHKDLAVQMAAYHASRGRPKQLYQTASLAPGLPKLLTSPQLADRRIGLGTLATADERAMLAALSAEPPPRLIGALSPADRGKHKALYRQPHVVAAPAFDEEHPEELSYRPFPIAPFLTMSASADDPALGEMVHPNLAKILASLDQETAAPMRLRPGQQPMLKLWSHQFEGDAVNLAALIDTDAAVAAAPKPAGRKMATQAP